MSLRGAEDLVVVVVVIAEQVVVVMVVVVLVACQPTARITPITTFEARGGGDRKGITRAADTG